MRRLAWFLSLMLVSFTAAAAGDDAELQRLRNALSLLNQEQQAVYQQFQMVQELRRDNAQRFTGTLPPYSGDVPNYTEVVEAQKKQIRHGDDLAQRAEQLYEKYSEIEAKKQPIQQRIFEITLSK